MLQGMKPQEWVFRERQKMAQTNFLLRSKGDGYSQTSSLANNLQYYPPGEILFSTMTFISSDDFYFVRILRSVDCFIFIFTGAHNLQH